MANYYEQLKDPRWQRKRLEVMERSGFECQWCNDSEQTLHVHHTLYRKGAAPWEYSPEELLCVCETCHREAKEKLDRVVAVLGYLAPQFLDQVMGYASALLALADTELRESLMGLSDLPNTNKQQMAFGIADTISRSSRVEDVLALLEAGQMSNTILWDMVYDRA